MLRGHYNQHRRVPYEKLTWIPELPVVVITPEVLERYDVGVTTDVESHWHNSIEVIYTNESSSRVVVNGACHSLQPHELFVINSQHLHRFPETTSTPPTRPRLSPRTSSCGCMAWAMASPTPSMRATTRLCHSSATA